MADLTEKVNRRNWMMEKEILDRLDAIVDVCFKQNYLLFLHNVKDISKINNLLYNFDKRMFK